MLASIAPLTSAHAAQAAEPATACAPGVVPAGGNRIWAQKAGAGAVTVVFEAGFGNDSSVWSAIAPRIQASGAQTLVYDRAGMGQSTLDANQPYSLDNDVSILRTVLTQCGVTGPVVFVGHSYGGAIGLSAAAQDDRIKGMVLLDAVVPGVWTAAELNKNIATMRAQYDELRQKSPELAKVAIPYAEALPQTARKLNETRVPERLPIIDIVAENGQADAESAKVWRAAHVGFDRRGPRKFVLAEGSSHKVAADKPDLVVSSIQTMVQRVSAAKP